MVHVAASSEVTHRTAIQAPTHRLELIDDLHGAYLRCADEGASGKGRREQLESIALRSQRAVHAADDMHYVAIALDRAIRRDVHAPCLRDTAEIVAREV